VAHFEILSAHPPIGVILSAAAFQAERRISRLTGPARKPNCTTTKIQHLRKFKTLGNPTFSRKHRREAYKRTPERKIVVLSLAYALGRLRVSQLTTVRECRFYRCA
jgi:hypothetical protein